jgi:hypothetical protein
MARVFKQKDIIPNIVNVFFKTYRDNIAFFTSKLKFGLFSTLYSMMWDSILCMCFTVRF